MNMNFKILLSLTDHLPTQLRLNADPSSLTALGEWIINA